MSDPLSLEAWLRLSLHLAFQPEVALAHLERAGGDPQRALRDFHSRARARVASRRTERRPLPEAGRELARLSERGIALVPVSSTHYPDALRRLVDAPPVLYVRGRLEALSSAAPVVAIVGSRAASAYGLAAATRFARAAAEAGVVVVSGLAIGIDGAAHRAALDAGGMTVAVQARGLDGVYPRRHRALAEEIRERGALVSELPLGVPPRRAFFPMRNRLIAGLARAVLVVEARERSGSLVTARLAAERGIDVLAVPGPIDVPTSAGPNRLVQDGATPVLGEADLLDALGVGPVADRRGGEGTSDRPAWSSQLAVVLLERLGRGPIEAEELRDCAGADSRAGEFELALVELELAGAIAQDRDGRWRVTGV